MHGTSGRKLNRFNFTSPFHSINLKELLLLCIILILGFIIRIYKLQTLPVGFYEEEMTNAYIGKFILLNGKDIYGNIFPLAYFDKFGDFPPVIPMYFSGISALLIGNSEIAARLPVAIFGALTIIVVFILASRWFGNTAALYASLILALLPWHVVLSRTTSEGILGLAAYIWGIERVFAFIRKKNIAILLASSGLFILSYFLYPSLRLLVPMTLLPIPFIFCRSDRHTKVRLIGQILFFCIITGLIATSVWGKARFEQTSVFHNPDVQQSILSRNTALHNGEGRNNVLIARVFHNRITGNFRELARQYLSYFSPLFLFFEAGGQYRYYNVPDQGLLFMVMIPFLFMTLFAIHRNTHSRYLAFTVWLLAVTPISAALTVDFTPHAHRAIFMILPFTFITAYGLVTAERIIPPKMVRFGFCIILAIEVVYFWHHYETHADTNQSVLRNDGDKEMITYVIREMEQYTAVYIPAFERLPLYYLYFTDTYDSTLIGSFKPGLQPEKSGKVVFYHDWCPTKYLKPESLPPEILIVDNATCDRNGKFAMKKTIVRSDSTEAYYIYSNN